MRQETRPSRIISRQQFLAAAVAACFTISAQALPTAPTVVNGTAGFARSGNLLTVTNSAGAIINWQKFGIGAGETTRFIQPSASASVLNQVIGVNGNREMSQIYGTLSSNGKVWLVNPAGILVGAGGVIDTAGFVASTLNVRAEDFLAGRLNFQATAGAGDVINRGAITTPTGGSVYLVGANVSNESSGIISTPGGETILAAGATVELIDTSTPGVKVAITGTADNATNLGSITAQAGRIGIAGAIVRNSGTLDASSVVNEGGRIFLKASQDTYVEGAARLLATGTKGGQVEVLGNRVAVMDQASIDASGETGGGRIMVGGDYQGKNPDIQNASITYFGPEAFLKANALKVGAGGTAIVWADDTTRAYGRIEAKGGLGGNGGFVETSGHRYLDVHGIRVNTSPPHGISGNWLLDPVDLAITGGSGDSDGDANPGTLGTAGSGVIGISDPYTSVYQSEIEGQSLTTNITLQATTGITTSGTFTGNTITLANNRSLSISTRNNNTGDGATGIDLTCGGTCPNLEFKTQGTGTITLETGTAGATALSAPITVGKLTSAGGTITINSSGNVTTGSIINSGVGGAVSIQGNGIAIGSGGVELTTNGTLALRVKGGTISQTGRIKAPSLNIQQLLGGGGEAINLGLSSNEVTTLSFVFPGTAYTALGQVNVRNSVALWVNADDTVSDHLRSNSSVVIATNGNLTLGLAGLGSIEGTDITLAASGGNFINIGDATALNPTTGNWRIWSTSRASDTATNLPSTADFHQYSATYPSTTVVGTGNGFLYSSHPTINLSLSGAAPSRTYDGTSAASGAGLVISGTAPNLEFDNTPTTTFSGTFAYDSKNVGTGKLVTSTVDANPAVGARTNSGDTFVYGITATGQTASIGGGVITPATLSAVTGITANDKAYDATTTATLNLDNASFTGQISGDSLAVASAVGAFADKNTGVGKLVNISGIALSGADAGNYTLESTSTNTLADITPLALSSWTGTAGNWSNPANWSRGIVPESGNVLAASIPAGASVTYDGGNTSLNSFSSSGSFVLPGGALAISDSFSSSQFSQSGGSLSAGSFTVTNAFSQTAGTLAVSGTANITQTSGNLSIANLSAGSANLVAATGAITQTGAILAESLSTRSATGTTLLHEGNQITQFQAHNTGPSDIQFANTGTLSLTDVNNAGGSILIDNHGGINVDGAIVSNARVTITAHSPLTVNVGTSISGAGDVTLTALSSGPTSTIDMLNIYGSVSSTGGNITLEGGSGVTVGSTASLSALLGRILATSAYGNVFIDPAAAINTPYFSVQGVALWSPAESTTTSTAVVSEIIESTSDDPTIYDELPTVESIADSGFLTTDETIGGGDEEFGEGQTEEDPLNLRKKKYAQCKG